MIRNDIRSLHCFSRRFHVLCVVVIGLLSIPILAYANTPDEQATKIDTMEPTVFLIERDGRLLQRIDATLTVPNEHRRAEHRRLISPTTRDRSARQGLWHQYDSTDRPCLQVTQPSALKTGTREEDEGLGELALI